MVVVIFPHGVSPTGFGIVQHEGSHNTDGGSAGNLQATSPCCGSFIEWGPKDDYVCLECRSQVDRTLGESWNIGHYVDLGFNDIPEWALGVLGFNDGEAKVEIEW